MAANAKKVELTETLMDVWRRKQCLGDITTYHYKSHKKNQKSIYSPSSSTLNSLKRAL